MSSGAYDSWITPALAGRILGVTPQRIRQLSNTGEIISIRTQLGRLIDPASVERLRTKRETQRAKAEPPLLTR
jgi:hypothetical protein